MARADRLFRLLQAMRELPAPVTAARLAEETGMSLRSIYRDIDSLRLAGARIEGERGYGYRLTEDHALPPQTFDRLELETLALGLAEVRHMGDPSLVDAANAALAKIAATLPSDREQQLFHAISRVYRPEARFSSPVDMTQLRQACWDERALLITYADKAEATTERVIWPLAVVYAERSLVVLAWCCLREDFRMFRPERIRSVAATGTSFRPRRAPLLREYMAKLEARQAGVTRR
jgi:predicted DNA-binding transcriptional regulator YafY